jgi:hypothetical protein
MELILYTLGFLVCIAIGLFVLMVTVIGRPFGPRQTRVEFWSGIAVGLAFVLGAFAVAFFAGGATL